MPPPAETAASDLREAAHHPRFADALWRRALGHSAALSDDLRDRIDGFTGYDLHAACMDKIALDIDLTHPKTEA